MADKTTDQHSIIDRLFAVGAHFGYSKSRRHPSASTFLFGAKGDVELFDLEQTAVALEKAKAELARLGKEGKTVLWVAGKAEARQAVQAVAARVGSPYVTSRWIGGTLTNFSEIKKRLERLKDLTSMREKGELAKFTKLERLLIDREIDELTRVFGGIRELTKIPDALVIVDPRREKIAVAEADVVGIPVIALAGSDCDMNGVILPIPANDSAVASVGYIVRELGDAYVKGKEAIPTTPAA